MKKILAISLCVVVMAAFAILGISAATALTAPVVTLTDKTLSWTAVPKAATYDVYSGDSLIATVSSTSIDLSNYLTKSGRIFFKQQPSKLRIENYQDYGGSSPAGKL